MTYHGRCACGAVTATLEGEPVAVRQCWCSDCQRMSGGGPTHNAIFPADGVTLNGDLASHAHLAASGNTLTAYFCATCGTPAYATSSARLQYRTMRLGFLTGAHRLKPAAAIWTDSAPEWAVIDPALPNWPDQPPAPQQPQD